ncbi:GNAT family N-acetyltransferase [Marinimicrobium sp. ABcell2]|uniref:GNAT family N-acetyltransferase n=1 Tax=Marinimicrobium sp. ABcell2 TaxID=3069751 RepID=UPI0027B6662E|nr:GNAT family N-acetyltransferase [Marinimicrobium sp. ABcell2]MDQ2077738.1 GNAT family N-acetyltransferase [Marinimicrobium sp. ABcell2]
MNRTAILDIARMRGASIFKLTLMGSVMGCTLIMSVFGVGALFGLEILQWNEQYVTGIKGLVASPFIGAFVGLLFGVFSAVFVYVGLRFYSLFSGISLEYIPSNHDNQPSEKGTTDRGEQQDEQEENALLVQDAVITTYLEMTDRSAFQPAGPPAIDFQLVQVELPCPELNRFLYTSVGADLCWYSRLPWSYAQWLAYLDRPELETWVAYVSGTPAGYFELERQSGGNVEIAYFGLMPNFIGKGIGGALLSEAIARAWDMGAKRVWVHTCSLDHPQACQNYQARGFTVFKTEESLEELPDHNLEPWPGADRPPA